MSVAQEEVHDDICKFETANIKVLLPSLISASEKSPFTAVRIVAFSVRAYMQKHLTQNLAIVYEVGAVGAVKSLAVPLCLTGVNENAESCMRAMLT